METRSNHVLVGAVVLILLAVLAIFTVWIARLGSTSEKEYDIFFKQAVDGLAKGSAVTFSGRPVGPGEGDRAVEERSAVRACPGERQRQDTGVGGDDGNDLRRRLYGSEPGIARRRAQGRALDCLPRHPQSPGLPLWRAGHPDQTGRARRDPEFGAAIARAAVDADRAADGIAVRSQPDLDCGDSRKTPIG